MKNWRDEETMEAAAVRLLRVLNERTEKRLAGSLKGPAGIQGPAEALENADGASDGLGTLKRRPQHTDEGRHVGDHTGGAKTDSGFEEIGQADLQARHVRFSFEVAEETACPVPDDSTTADRATALRKIG